MTRGWIGVDLDGTMAQHGKWQGPGWIGEPIAPICNRVRQLLEAGYQVKCFTARMENTGSDVLVFLEAWQQWSQATFGQVLEATATKDFAMIELWDDRCVAVECNTGQFLSPSQLIK